MNLKMWNNGDTGEIAQAIIESNFKILGRYLSKNVLALSSQERKALSSDYLSEKLIVFDTDEKKWFEYINGKWEVSQINNSSNINVNDSENKSYVLDFSSADWNNNVIYIPYSNHLISNPTASLYFFIDGAYELVLGGVQVDSDYNITISSDGAYDGKVVIK